MNWRIVYVLSAIGILVISGAFGMYGFTKIKSSDSATNQSDSSISLARMNVIHQYPDGFSANSEGTYNMPEDGGNVTIFQNGFTQVSFKFELSLKTGINYLGFDFPDTALFDSLKITGVDVQEVRFDQHYQDSALYRDGDLILVRTGTGNITGYLADWGSSWVTIEAGNVTTSIPNGLIQEIVLIKAIGKRATEPSRVNITAVSSGGLEEISISYLMCGPIWFATYSLDVVTSQLECWASVKNPLDWRNVTLTVVAGGPHVVYRYYNGYNSYASYEYYSAAPLVLPSSCPPPATGYSSPDGTDAWYPVGVDEYYEYTLDRNVTVDRGESIRIMLFNGTTDLRQGYFWGADSSYIGNPYDNYEVTGAVSDRYYITDNFKTPLPTGQIDVYRGDRWIGEDVFTYTPVNHTNYISTSSAYDIVVTQKVVGFVQNYTGYKSDTTIVITNYKTCGIDLLIEELLPSSGAVVSSNPPAVQDGPKLSWNLTLKPGENLTLDFSFVYP